MDGWMDGWTDGLGRVQKEREMDRQYVSRAHRPPEEDEGNLRRPRKRERGEEGIASDRGGEREERERVRREKRKRSERGREGGM